MKAKIFLLVIFFNTALLSSSFSQAGKENAIYISSVSYMIETFYSISCPQFETQFKGRMNQKIVNSADTVAMLADFLKKVKYSKHDGSMDIRAKMTYKNMGSETEICMSMFDAAINGRQIKHNEKFMRLLRALAWQYYK